MTLSNTGAHPELEKERRLRNKVSYLGQALGTASLFFLATACGESKAPQLIQGELTVRANRPLRLIPRGATEPVELKSGVASISVTARPSEMMRAAGFSLNVGGQEFPFQIPKDHLSKLQSGETSLMIPGDESGNIAAIAARVTPKLVNEARRQGKRSCISHYYPQFISMPDGNGGFTTTMTMQPVYGDESVIYLDQTIVDEITVRFLNAVGSGSGRFQGKSLPRINSFVVEVTSSCS